MIVMTAREMSCHYVFLLFFIGHNFLVPALWKRLAAEFIDFFFLFMIKLGIVLLTVDYFGAL